MHIGAKVGTTRAALRHGGGGEELTEPAAGMSRRQLLATAFGTSALVTAVTIGQTYRPLRKLALLAPRRPDVGPQGFPVNRTARAAGVLETATATTFRLEIHGRGVTVPTVLTLDEVRALPQHRAVLPIACVEGWSSTQEWEGVRVRDLLERAGAPAGADVRVESLQAHRSYRSSFLNAEQARDDETLLALRVRGEPLALDHGFPMRLIAPNRPGVDQTKWVTRLVVL